MSERWPITGTAQLGKVEMRLFPYSEHQTAVDDYDVRPWAVGAMVRIKFTIGELTTTKRVTQRFTFRDARGWPVVDRPSPSAIAEASETVLRNLRTQIARHGFDPGPLTAVIMQEGDPA